MYLVLAIAPEQPLTRERELGFTTPLVQTLPFSFFPEFREVNEFGSVTPVVSLNLEQLQI